MTWKTGNENLARRTIVESIGRTAYRSSDLPLFHLSTEFWTNAGHARQVTRLNRWNLQSISASRSKSFHPCPLAREDETNSSIANRSIKWSAWGVVSVRNFERRVRNMTETWENVHLGIGVLKLGFGCGDRPSWTCLKWNRIPSIYRAHFVQTRPESDNKIGRGSSSKVSQGPIGK